MRLKSLRTSGAPLPPHASLARLGLERVDILHLHNAVTAAGGGETLSPRQVLDEVVPAFEALRQAGKIRFLGVTAVGETAALHQVIELGGFASAQVVYNMLNSSAAAGTPRRPGQDYAALLDRTRRPAPAWSPSACSPAARCWAPPNAILSQGPRLPRIGSAASYALDVAHAQRLQAVGAGRRCARPRRGRCSLCHLPCRGRHHPGRHGHARPVPAGPGRRPQRPLPPQALSRLTDRGGYP